MWQAGPGSLPSLPPWSCALHPLNLRFLGCPMDILPYLPRGPVVSITWERLRRVGGSASKRDVRPLCHQEAGMPDLVGQGGPILMDGPGRGHSSGTGAARGARASRTSMSSGGKIPTQNSEFSALLKLIGALSKNSRFQSKKYKFLYSSLLSQCHFFLIDFFFVTTQMESAYGFVIFCCCCSLSNVF